MPASTRSIRRRGGRAALIALTLGLAGSSSGVAADVRATAAHEPCASGETRAPEERLAVAFETKILAQGLAYPWGLAFLPDGRMLVTERPGRLRIVATDGGLSPPVAGVPTVLFQGQGGLLDVALDPAFARNHLVYLAFSEPQAAGGSALAVARAELVDGPRPLLAGLAVIYRQDAAAAPGHFGARLVFGPGDTLFVTQGDRNPASAGGRSAAQDMKSLLGKIVRLRRDGAIPIGNPFRNRAGARPEIWSLGHANVQAAAFRPGSTTLWAVEHGPLGGDELNVIRRGHNYGWPVVSYGRPVRPGDGPDGGRTAAPGLEAPAYHWDAAIAPSGMVFYTGRLFPAWRGSLLISGLSSGGRPGGSVVRLSLHGRQVVGEERLDLPPAAWRDIRQGPGGEIYLLRGGADGQILALTPR